MTRGYSECCHYDEGYDDGYDDGKDEAAGGDRVEQEPLVAAIRFLARERFLCGDHDAAALLERVADEVARDPFFDMKLEKEQEREKKLAEEYAASRKAAA